MNIRNPIRRPQRGTAAHSTGSWAPSFPALLAAAAAIPVEPPRRAPEPAKRPDGFAAGYTTAGGGRVEVVKRSGYYGHTELTETHAFCTGCGKSETFEWGWSPWAHQTEQPQDRFDEGGQQSTPQARDWALDHSRECTELGATPTDRSTP